MRYNKQELFALASQTSQNFDREGVLILKERQDSFFRRSEGCSVRWFRLRGNLLFYLKGPEPWYEPLGVIVLGNHQVSVQTQDENGHWPFQIVWENGVCYRMATFLESERTLWLKAMEAAPYEHMAQRIADLNRQLDGTRTMIDLRKYRITNKIINDFNEVPLCELSLSCDNLLCDANGNPPTPFAAIIVLFPEKGLCVRYCSTEAVEEENQEAASYCMKYNLQRCSNPCFSRTVMFRGSDGITSDVLVRIAVYDIRESVTQTGVSIGSVTMRLSHIQEAQRLRVPLLTVDDKTVGFVTINGWSLEPSHAGASPSHPNTERNSIDLTPKVLCHRRSQSLPPRLGLKLKYPSYGLLIRQNFMNPHQATYRFHSGLGGEITVHEAIAEPRFCFTMPLQLIEIFMNREKELLESMLAFAEITKRVTPRQLDLVSTHLSVMKLYQAAKKAQELFNAHLSVMKIYQGAKKSMLQYSAIYFKPSSKKEDAEMGFVPINLHLQRMWVHNDTLNKTGFHDVVTVGAFSAHSHRADRPGGLIKLVQQSKDISTEKAEMMANTNRLDAEFEKLNAMRTLRNYAVTNMDKALILLQASQFLKTNEPVEEETLTDCVKFDHPGRKEQLAVVLQDIKDQVSKVLALWNDELVEEALSKIGWNKKLLDEETEALRLADRLAMQAHQAAAPEGAAGASAPEGAAGTDSPSTNTPAQEAAAAAAAVHSSSVNPPVTNVSEALEAALSRSDNEALEAALSRPDNEALEAALSRPDNEALEAALSRPDNEVAEGAIAVLAALSSTDQQPEIPSSSSSCNTTPISDIACALSASVPDMQKSTELQFQNDYFENKSETNPRSDLSETSGASGQSERSAKSNRSGKTRGAKNNRSKNSRGGKRNGNEKSGWNHSFRSNREVKPKVAEGPTQLCEHHSNVRTDFKSSASLEQVSYKSLVNNKKADKKKAKKNRREREQTPPVEAIDPQIREYNLTFFKDVTTAIDDMLFNVSMSLNDISEKGSYTASEFEDTKILMDLLIKLMDEAYKWTRMAHTAMRIDIETPKWTLEKASLQSRRDTCFSQALTTATAGLVCWLSSAPGEIVAKVIQSGLGPLCGFEGLLSLYAQEKTMWGDMVVAIEDLHTVVFKLVMVTSSTPVIPQVTGHRNAVIVELPVSESLYARFDNSQMNPTFTVTAVFFNIGINEKASVAGALGECKPQHYSNSDNLERMLKYYHKYTKVFPADPMEPLRASSRSKPLEEVMENLKVEVQKRAPKNVEVLQLAALATRLMHGIRFTSCKSAKDRTGMSVTLEQTNILSSEYHLADHERKRALNIMRSEGCRRENTMKNIGMSKYAFSKKQVMSLPEDYRPPQGSYGSTLT